MTLTLSGSGRSPCASTIWPRPLSKPWIALVSIQEETSKLSRSWFKINRCFSFLPDMRISSRYTASPGIPCRILSTTLWQYCRSCGYIEQKGVIPEETFVGVYHHIQYCFEPSCSSIWWRPSAASTSMTTCYWQNFMISSHNCLTRCLQHSLRALMHHITATKTGMEFVVRQWFKKRNIS